MAYTYLKILSPKLPQPNYYKTINFGFYILIQTLRKFKIYIYILNINIKFIIIIIIFRIKKFFFFLRAYKELIKIRFLYNKLKPLKPGMTKVAFVKASIVQHLKSGGPRKEVFELNVN